MTRTEFEEKSFEEVMELLDEQRDDITTYDRMKEFVKAKVDNDNLNVAIHVLEALKEEAEWYEYDYCMGTLQTPSAITEKEDVEHLIED